MARLLVPLAFVVVVVRIASAAPDREPAPAPVPPSTGKELATPRVVLPADVQARIARQVIQKGDCTGRVAELSTAFSVAGARLAPEERIEAAVLLERCARANKSWTKVLQASAYLLDHSPAKLDTEDMITAYLTLGDEWGAFEALKKITRSAPAQRASVTAALSLIACHKNDFQLCFDTSSKMLAVLAKDRAASRRRSSRTRSSTRSPPPRSASTTSMTPTWCRSTRCSRPARPLRASSMGSRRWSSRPAPRTCSSTPITRPISRWAPTTCSPAARSRTSTTPTRSSPCG